MDKVQKHNSFNTNTPSSESYRNYLFCTELKQKRCKYYFIKEWMDPVFVKRASVFCAHRHLWTADHLQLAYVTSYTNWGTPMYTVSYRHVIDLTGPLEITLVCSNWPMMKGPYGKLEPYSAGQDTLRLYGEPKAHRWSGRYGKRQSCLSDFNWALRHEGVSGEWRYSSTYSLTPALDGCVWSASRPGLFTPAERAPSTHWIGGWVGTRAVLDAVRKFPVPAGYRTPVAQFVASHYSDWAMTPHIYPVSILIVSSQVQQ